MCSEQKASILTALRGQSITLPDLTGIFQGWPKEVNKCVGQLRRDSDEWLDMLVSNKARRESLKAADFGYFGATWWPRARYERLKVITFYVIWLFIVDDEFDDDTGSMSDNLELSDQYRMDALEFLRHSLGLSDSTWDPNKPVNPVVKSFEIVGVPVREAYNHDQRQRFYDHTKHYLDMTHKEQTVVLQGTLPSLQEFWSYRLGISATHPVLALIEFASENQSLPTSVFETDEMKLLWDCANVLVSTVNDICSLKKEIAVGSVHSMIPIMYTQTNDLQAAVNQAADFLALKVKEYQELAQRVLSAAAQDEVVQMPELSDFVKGCEYCCSGNLYWSLMSHRYGIYEEDLGSKTMLKL